MERIDEQVGGRKILRSEERGLAYHFEAVRDMMHKVAAAEIVAWVDSLRKLPCVVAVVFEGLVDKIALAPLNNCTLMAAVPSDFVVVDQTCTNITRILKKYDECIIVPLGCDKDR